MAARASLAALGKEDVILSGEPEVTYFVERYKGHTPFAQRVDPVNFQADYVYLGAESYAILPRSGDLISKMYLKINFPVDQLGSSVFRDSVGTLMIDYVELYIGSRLVERFWGEFLALKWDLEVPQAKQGALTGLIGKGTQAAASSYTVPLPFSILKKGLPICAFQEDVTVRLGLHPSTVFTSPAISISPQLDVELDVEYTYLSEPEVQFIQSKPLLYIFEQLQKNEFFIPQGVNAITCPLSIINSVKEMYLTIQNDSASGYDYSNVTNGSTDQLSNLVMFFNSTDRISADVGTPIFLRNIQALEFHTRVPEYLFYMYSFSLDPESDEPTGHVNFSRIDQKNLALNLNPSLANRYITIYALSYNFLMVGNATADVIFKNYIS
jgi:hypothetical protein